MFEPCEIRIDETERFETLEGKIISYSIPNELAKYKVQDVKEEDGVYTVSVQVEPSNVFQTLQQSSTEVSNEKIKQGLDGNDPEVFAAVLTESVQKSLEKNRYGKAVTVNVSVEKDNSGKYGLLDTEMNKLEAAMFPTE